MRDANEINADEVAVCQVIVCTKERRGKGTFPSPIRVITEVFNLDGKKIAEHDPVNELFTDMDIVRFCEWLDTQPIQKVKPDHVYQWLKTLEK